MTRRLKPLAIVAIVAFATAAIAMDDTGGTGDLYPSSVTSGGLVKGLKLEATSTASDSIKTAGDLQMVTGKAIRLNAGGTSTIGDISGVVTIDGTSADVDSSLRVGGQANDAAISSSGTVVTYGVVGSGADISIEITPKGTGGTTVTTGAFAVTSGSGTFTSLLPTADSDAMGRTLAFSGALNFPSIAAQKCEALTITETGAAVNDPIAPSWPAALDADLDGIMFVSATNTVTVRVCNPSSGAIDPASLTFGGRILR